MCGAEEGSGRLGSSSAVLSRLAVLFGLLSMAALMAALLGSSWIFTVEPVRLPPATQRTDAVSATVTFRIGLWKVCPSLRKHNASHALPSPSCSLVKYFSWDEVKHSDLGILAPIEFTPAFISRMRISTPLEGAGLAFLISATLCALLGHCSNDHRTLVACGLFILGGLSLGGGLVVFASVLSDAYVERPKAHSDTIAYQYGWSFFAAATAFIAAQMAALLSVTAYVRRFPSPEALLLKLIPGGVEAASLTPDDASERRKWRWSGEALFSPRASQYVLRRGRRLVDEESSTPASAGVPEAGRAEEAPADSGAASSGPPKARPCSVPTPPDVCHSERVVVVVGGESSTLVYPHHAQGPPPPPPRGSSTTSSSIRAPSSFAELRVGRGAPRAIRGAKRKSVTIGAFTTMETSVEGSVGQGQYSSAV